MDEPITTTYLDECDCGHRLSVLYSIIRSGRKIESQNIFGVYYVITLENISRYDLALANIIATQKDLFNINYFREEPIIKSSSREVLKSLEPNDIIVDDDTILYLTDLYPDHFTKLLMMYKIKKEKDIIVIEGSPNQLSHVFSEVDDSLVEAWMPDYD